MKHIKYLLLAVFIISIALFWYKSCSLFDKYSELKGRYDALSQEYDTYRVSAIAEIADLNTIISQKDELIVTLNERVEEKYNEVEELHGISEELESAYTKLTDNLAKIDNLEKQVSIWKQKFTLAESIIADKDRIIFSLNEKYNTQLQITTRYKQLYENEVNLRTLAEDRLSLADKKLSGLRFQINLGKGIVIGLGALIIYGLIR